MREQIVQKMGSIETDLDIYFRHLKDPSVSPKDRSVVSFKLLNDMMAFSVLHELVPEYVPTPTTGIIMAQGLGGVVGYVSTKDGHVVISPEYDKMLAQKDAYLAQIKNNGKVV